MRTAPTFRAICNETCNAILSSSGIFNAFYRWRKSQSETRRRNPSSATFHLGFGNRVGPPSRDRRSMIDDGISRRKTPKSSGSSIFALHRATRLLAGISGECCVPLAGPYQRPPSHESEGARGRWGGGQRAPIGPRARHRKSGELGLRGRQPNSRLSVGQNQYVAATGQLPLVPSFHPRLTRLSLRPPRLGRPSSAPSYPLSGVPFTFSPRERENARARERARSRRLVDPPFTTTPPPAVLSTTAP